MLFASLSHFMLRVTWTDSKHGMFCNMKAFDFGRFEESYPLYHLVVFLFFWGGGGVFTVIFCLISPTVFDTAPYMGFVKLSFCMYEFLPTFRKGFPLVSQQIRFDELIEVCAILE